MTDTLKKAAYLLAFLLFGILITTCFFKCKKTTVIKQQDTSTVVIKQQNIIIASLKKENDSLKRIKKSDSIAFITLNYNISTLTGQHTTILNEIIKLPFDSACNYAQHDFKDTTKIQKLKINGQIRACITPVQLSEVNGTYCEKGYLIQLNDSLDKEVGLLLNTDNINNALLKNMQKMLDGKDTIIDIQTGQNATLVQERDLVTKRYKRQRFWKYVFKGGFITLLAILAVK